MKTLTPAEIAGYNESRRLLDVPTNQDGTPSFETPRDAIEALNPTKAKALKLLDPTPESVAAAKVILANTGLTGPDDHLALLPKIDELGVHQAAASAVVGHLITRFSLSKAKAIARAAAANPWLSGSSFTQNDKRLKQKAQDILKKPPRPRR